MRGQRNLAIFWHYSALCYEGSLRSTIDLVIEILDKQGHFNCILSDRTPSGMEHRPCPYHKLTYEQEGLQYGPLIKKFMDEHLPYAMVEPKDCVITVGADFAREHPTDIPLLYVDASEAVMSTPFLCLMNELTDYDSIAEAYATLEDRACKRGKEVQHYCGRLIDIVVYKHPVQSAGEESMLIPTIKILTE